MANVQSKLANNRKRKAENETEILIFEEKELEVFLKIFVELIIKDPEETEKLIKEEIDRPDGVGLNTILLAVSKLRELLKGDIDSLKIPNFMKTSIKLLKTFFDFLNASKLLKTLKDASSKKVPLRGSRPSRAAAQASKAINSLLLRTKKNVEPALGVAANAIAVAGALAAAAPPRHPRLGRPKPSGGIG